MPHILNKNGLIGVLDIGSSKTACLIARPVSVDKAFIVGAGIYQCKGVKSSVIVDIEETTESIRNSLEKAEQIANERIENVALNVPVRSFTSTLLHASMSLGSAEVTLVDLNRLIAKARNQIEKNDFEVLHCIPVDYSIDNLHAIRDPRGLAGENLSVTLHAITCPPAPIRNLHTVLEQCHLHCVQTVVSPYAAGLACLTSEELKQGSCVIDLGADTTKIGVFYEGQLVFAAHIPLGGNHITKDLACRFKTSFAHAERLKTLHGSAYLSQTYRDEDIEIPLLGEDERVSLYHVSRMDFVDIIIPRIKETFLLVQNQLEQNHFFDICQNFVLTGGASQLQSIREMASSVLQKNVRIGHPLIIFDRHNIVPQSHYPLYMGCFGLLKHALNAQVNAPDHRKDIQKRTSRLGQFFHWFLDNC